MDSNDNNDLLTQSFLADEPSYIVSPEDVIAEQSENTDDSSSGHRQNAPLREQDRFLPIANIVKIMKRAVPDNGKIAKDARECVQECISEFISFITSEATDRCYVEKRKTINGEDIIFAMSTLGFDNYFEPMKLYLHKYRDTILAASKGEKIRGPNFDEMKTIQTTGIQLSTEEGEHCDTVIYSYPDNNINFQLGVLEHADITKNQQV